MERIWRRVQSAGHNGGVNPPTTTNNKIVEIRSDALQSQQKMVSEQLDVKMRSKNDRAPQTITCGCKLQPCPVHPVIIRVKRSRDSSVSKRLQDKQSGLYPVRSARSVRSHRLRRCDCSERQCPHVVAGNRRRPQGLSSLFESNSAAVATALSAGTGNHPHCPHGDGEVCDCEANAQPCLHSVHKSKNNNHTRRSCNCPNQPCQHQHCEGRIKRVKGRVRRVGSAMARYTADLAMLHMHWQLASECAPCRLNSITRRFCRRQNSDNELYRSNSFNFKRFERNDDNSSASMSKKVSLCDNYSLPVDFVYKKRLNIDKPTPYLDKTSSNIATDTTKIEVLEQYCYPKDRKSLIEPHANLFQPLIDAKIHNDWSESYTDSTSGSSCEDRSKINRFLSSQKQKNSAVKPLSINQNFEVPDRVLEIPTKETREDTKAQFLKYPNTHLPSGCTETLNLHHSSPYYYGDLFKPSSKDGKKIESNTCKKNSRISAANERSNSLDIIPQQHLLSETKDIYLRNINFHPKLQDEFNVQQINEIGRSLSITLTDNEAHDALNVEVLSRCAIDDWNCSLMPPHRLYNYELPTDCTCFMPLKDSKLELTVNSNTGGVNTVSYPTGSSHSVRQKVHKLRRSRKKKPQSNPIKNPADETNINDESDREYEDEEDDVMARQRHIYETAFDSKISKPEDDIESLNQMVNHSLIISKVRSDAMTSVSGDSSSAESLKKSQKILHQELHTTKKSPSKSHPNKSKTLLTSSIQPDEVDQSSHPLEEQFNQTSNILQDRSHPIQSSVESSSLPRVFSCNYAEMQNSVLTEGSARENSRVTPVQEYAQQCDKDLCLQPCADSLHPALTSRKNHILEIKDRPISLNYESKEFILEFKDRPKESMLYQQNSSQSQPQRRRRRRSRPRSLICDNKSMSELKSKPQEVEDDRNGQDRQVGLIEMKLKSYRRRQGYSSTESMVMSSSSGSMESLRSSTSEGNRSTSSNESRHSNSLSSHSSDSSSCLPSGFQFHIRHHQQPGSLGPHSTKLHILSPISDKSLQEPVSETSDSNRNNNSQKVSPEEDANKPKNENDSKIGIASISQENTSVPKDVNLSLGMMFKDKCTLQSKNLINLTLQSSSADTEVQGSDSGISIESRTEIKCNKPFSSHSLKFSQQQSEPLGNVNPSKDIDNELLDLPFDMPKLRRRKLLAQQEATTSGSATSIDLTDLPFDMPKLRRRLKCSQNTLLNSVQTSSDQPTNDFSNSSVIGNGSIRPKLLLDLDGSKVGNQQSIGKDSANSRHLPLEKPSQLSLGLSFETSQASADLVDVELPLERQGWYHGSITRIEAEAILRLLQEGSYLVRNSESTKQDYSLSLKSAKGFMHMRIQKNKELNAYILGQFSKPFNSIPEMVRHFSINRLPIRGAEHMCLLHPVIAQLL